MVVHSPSVSTLPLHLYVSAVLIPATRCLSHLLDRIHGLSVTFEPLRATANDTKAGIRCCGQAAHWQQLHNSRFHPKIVFEVRQSAWKSLSCYNPPAAISLPCQLMLAMPRGLQWGSGGSSEHAKTDFRRRPSSVAKLSLVKRSPRGRIALALFEQLSSETVGGLPATLTRALTLRWDIFTGPCKTRVYKVANFIQWETRSSACLEFRSWAILSMEPSCYQVQIFACRRDLAIGVRISGWG